jgi:hypothetical protein
MTSVFAARISTRKVQARSTRFADAVSNAEGLFFLARRKGDDDGREMCLGKFASSVVSGKCETLMLSDTAMLRLVGDYTLGLFEIDYRAGSGERDGVVTEDAIEDKISKLKKSTLYQVVVATGTCMIVSENEKRHTLIDFLVQAAAEGGGGG